MTTTTAKPLRFESRETAQGWLNTTNNCGLIHSSGHDFIILQFAEDAVWAFCASDEMVLLPHW